jgi:hypothetical protein
MRTVFKLLFALVLVLSLLSNSSASLNLNEGHRDILTSDSGVEYEIVFFERNFTLLVSAFNPTDEAKQSGYVVKIDGKRQRFTTENISSGSEFNHKIELKEGLDILSTNHTIYFSTFGADTRFNFTKKIDYRNTTRFPKPQITNVTVANGTVDGEPSTVAYVTVSNPTNQLYSMKLLVHTEETQGGLYGGSTPEYTNRTVKVELLEEPGTTVAGEVRLYVGEPSEREGGLDQVEFVGRAGEDTEVYNRSYEPATGPWAEDSYVYENESVGDDDGWLGGSGTDPLVNGVVVAGFVVAVLVLVRRWR